MPVCETSPILQLYLFCLSPPRHHFCIFPPTSHFIHYDKLPYYADVPRSTLALEIHVMLSFLCFYICVWNPTWAHTKILNQRETRGNHKGTVGIKVSISLDFNKISSSVSSKMIYRQRITNSIYIFTKTNDNTWTF